MPTQDEIIEALKSRGLAYDQPAELQQFSGAYRKLPTVGKSDVFWYVRNNESSLGPMTGPQVRRGKTLATSVPVDLGEMLKKLPGAVAQLDRASDGASLTKVVGSNPAGPPPAGPDVIALLSVLREMYEAYWGKLGDEWAGDGIRPPPLVIQRAKALLDRYAGLLPPEGE